jgi:hypothetical protein
MHAELDRNDTPTQSYIERLKRKQMGQMGQPGVSRTTTKTASCRSASVAIRPILETCGRSRCEVSGADEDKNQLERSVCRMLCIGDITLETGQGIFLASDWREEYQRFFQT